MVKKYKRVQVVLCQDVQRLGWATCQRLSPNPDTLFYKFSNDVPVHRLFLDLRCDERSTPTHPVPSVWHASSRYTDSTNLPYPRFIFLHTYPATRIVPPPRVLWSVELHQDNQARFVIPIYYVLTDQGGELSCTREGFFLFFGIHFFLKNSFQVPWGVRVESLSIAYLS